MNGDKVSQKTANSTSSTQLVRELCLSENKRLFDLLNQVEIENKELNLTLGDYITKNNDLKDQNGFLNNEIVKLSKELDMEYLSCKQLQDLNSKLNAENNEIELKLECLIRELDKERDQNITLEKDRCNAEKE